MNFPTQYYSFMSLLQQSGMDDTTL